MDTWDAWAQDLMDKGLVTVWHLDCVLHKIVMMGLQRPSLEQNLRMLNICFLNCVLCSWMWQLIKYHVWMSKNQKLTHKHLHNDPMVFPLACTHVATSNSTVAFVLNTAWSMATPQWACLMASKPTIRFAPTLPSEHTVPANAHCLWHLSSDSKLWQNTNCKVLTVHNF